MLLLFKLCEVMQVSEVGCSHDVLLVKLAPCYSQYKCKLVVVLWQPTVHVYTLRARSVNLVYTDLAMASPAKLQCSMCPLSINHVNLGAERSLLTVFLRLTPLVI